MGRRVSPNDARRAREVPGPVQRVRPRDEPARADDHEDRRALDKGGAALGVQGDLRVARHDDGGPAELVHARMGPGAARGDRGHGAVRQVRRLARLVHRVAAPTCKIRPAAEAQAIFRPIERNDSDSTIGRNLILATRIRGARGRGIVEFRNERTWQNAVETSRTEEFHAAYEAAVDKVRADFGQKHPMIIGGQDVWATSTFEDTSPADTNLVLGLFQKGGRPHSKHAIKAAKAAFPHWATTAYTDRVRLVQRAADLIGERKFVLAALMSFENGKNRYEAMADVDEAADLMRWYAAEMLRNQGYERAMGQFLPGETTRSILKPDGVWAVVAPFNFPLAIAAGMSTGALITGNTRVFKPASDTPFMGLRLAEILRDAGVPSGVFNYVTGPGATVGQELVDNPDVDGFVFTGSRAVGMKALETFTRTRPKPIITEMGGKNPAIITANADLGKAARGGMREAFGYGGQKGSACSRVLVDEHVKEAVGAKLLSETGES